MAISGGDGSIILSTKVDTSGIKKGISEANKFAEMSINEQRSMAMSLSKIYIAQGQTQSEAQKNAWKNLKNNTVAAKDYQKALEGIDNKTKKLGKNSKKSFGLIKSSLSKIGGLMAAAFSVTKLIQFGKEAINLASDLQEVQNVVDTAFGSMSYKIEEFSKTAIENFGISKLTAKRTASTYMAMAKGMGIAEDEASDMAITMTGLTADIASFYNMSQERADVILKSVYTGETESLKQLGIVMTEVNLEQFALSKGITKNIRNMTQQEKTMLRYQFVLEQTRLAQGDFAKTQDSWANQTRILSERWKEMQATFGEAFMAIGTLFLPVINNIVSGLTQIAQMAVAASKAIYKLFTGKEMQTSQTQQANSIQQSVENQDALTKSVKETAEEQQKLLAGFDEITKLSETEKESTAGVVANQTPTTTGTPLTVDNTEAQKATTEISSTLATIMGIAGVALVAIGLLLIVTHHIAWGIGFIIAGAAALGVTIATLKSDKIGQDVKDKITAGLVIAGLIAVVLGILACFAQHWGLGISLIVLGATTIVGSIALNWNGVKQKLQGTLGKALAIVGAVAIVIGVLLCFAQKWLIGIGLIAAGAATLGVSIAANWDSIKQKLKGPLGTAIAIIGIVAIVIGILLCVAQQWVLGVGFIVLGAGSLGISIAANWDSLKEKLKNPLNTALAIIGIVAIVIGILLCVAQMWAIGIGLIALGATGMASATLDWNAIKTKVSAFFKENTGLVVGVSTALLVLGIILCVTGFMLPLGIGLIAVGAVGLATEAVLNFNTIKNKISEFFKNNAGLIVGVSTALLVIGIILCLTGGALPMGVGLIIAGSVGLASEVVLNWDTVKTKVSSAFDAVSAWIKTWGLLVLGIILVVSGVGLPLGLALIKKAGYNLTQAQSPLWNTITTKVQEAWQSIKNFWNTHIAKYFTAQWWSDLAKKMGNGLITGFENAVNSIITLFENMINWVVAGLNSISVQIPDWVPNYGGGKFGVNLPYVRLGRVSIPRLAQGAVIPPNKEFLAVLGDQKHGTNIETPLQTMIDAFNIALNQRDSGNQTIVLTVDGDVLFRTVVNKNRDYVNSMGVNPLGI